MNNDSQPGVTVSMSRKVNLGNYESADVFVSISNAKAGMTEEELRPLLDTAATSWALCREALLIQMKQGYPVVRAARPAQ